MKRKRVSALLLTALLALSGLAGCSGTGSGESTSGAETAAVEDGGDTADTSETVDGEAVVSSERDYSQEEHLDISISYWDVESNFVGGDDDLVLKTIEDKFNVTFVPQNISWDDYEQKLQLWAASDSLPDVFVGAYRTTATFSTWARQGLLKAIPDDLSAYPNLAEYMDSPELDTCKVDGQTYAIFRQTYQEQASTVRDRVVLYRWDLAQEAGITEEPTNWDEFREMVQAIIAADPEGKGVQGMIGRTANQLAGVFFPYSNPLAAVSGVTFYWVDNGDGTYVPAYFSGENLGDDMLPTWNLIRDMYEEGTLIRDVATATTTQSDEMFLQGQICAMSYDGSATNTYTNIGQYWKEIYGTEFLDDCRFLTVMEDVNGEQTWPIWDYAWSESYISSHVDDEKLDRILAIYDFLCSEEGTMLAYAGIEGDTYEIEDDGSIAYIDGEAPSGKYKSMSVFAYLVAWNPPLMDSDTFPSTIPAEYFEVNNKLEEITRSLEVPEYNYDCTTAFVGLGSDFSLQVEEDMLNIMTGTEPVEDMWQDIIDSYKADGLEDIIAQVNEAVQ